MINKAVFTVVIFFAVGFSWADKLVLKEGKTLTGKITKEDDTEVTIKLGGNMFLRLEKSKISEIIRTQPKQPQTFVPAIKEAAPPKPAVRKIKEEVTPSREQQGGVAVQETLIVRLSSVTAPLLVEAKTRSSQCFMTPQWSGVLNRDGGFKWSSVLVQATMTVTYPHWTVDVSSAEAQAWDAHLAKMENYEQGHIELQRQFLRNAGDALLNIRAKSEAALTKESDQIWDKYQDRLQNQRRGYDRRYNAHIEKKPLQ